MHTVQLFGITFSYLVAVVLFSATWILMGWIAKKFIFVGLKKLTQKTETRIDDILIEAAHLPALVLISTTGLGIAFKLFFPLSHQTRLTPFVPLAVKAIALLSVVVFIDRIVKNLLKTYSLEVEVLKMSQGFIGTFLRILIYFLGTLIILDSIGVSVTPIIASLGIGSLAVALALQPTLENLFSGFQIILDQPVKPGDFIRLESGEEGFVQRIGWRSTWIQQPTNNMIVIPNKLLVNSRVLNFYYPSKEMTVNIELGVHYNSDLDQVERLAMKSAQRIIQTHPAGTKSFIPIVRFHTFADSSINFSLLFRVNEFSEIGAIRHDIIKLIHQEFQREGIVIPYPIRAINTSQEEAKIK